MMHINIAYLICAFKNGNAFEMYFKYIQFALASENISIPKNTHTAWKNFSVLFQAFRHEMRRFYKTPKC